MKTYDYFVDIYGDEGIDVVEVLQGTIQAKNADEANNLVYEKFIKENPEIYPFYIWEISENDEII